MDALAAFTPATRSWFERAFARPTPAQEAAWPVIAGGAHVLVQAPTGSGKTLAAFLTGIDRLNARPGEGLRLLYVSPLKALNYDVERNLRGPLAGLGSTLSVGVRTGGHGAAGTPPDAARAAGHPDHDPGVALSAAHLAGPGHAAWDRDGHRRRGPRRRGHQAWRPSRDLAGAARAGRERSRFSASAFPPPSAPSRRSGASSPAAGRSSWSTLAPARISTSRSSWRSRTCVNPAPTRVSASPCRRTAWRWRQASRRRRGRSGRRSIPPCSTSSAGTGRRSCSSTTGGWPRGSRYG